MQVAYGFSLPMPLQLLLAPVYLVEFILTQAIGQVALSALRLPALLPSCFLCPRSMSAAKPWKLPDMQLDG